MEKPDTAAIMNHIYGRTKDGMPSPGTPNTLSLRLIIGDLCDYIDSLSDEKAAIEQVRKFVRDPENFLRATTMGDVRQLVLDFIDNGPPKRNAVETVFDAAEGRLTISDGRTIVGALREAGYLKDEA